MNSRLHQIKEWPELAQQANWSVSALAKLCGVSVGTLRRHFFKYMGKTTSAWVTEQRQHQAIELLRDGSAKLFGVCLGFCRSLIASQYERFDWGDERSGVKPERTRGTCVLLIFISETKFNSLEQAVGGMNC